MSHAGRLRSEKYSESVSEKKENKSHCKLLGTALFPHTLENTTSRAEDEISV